MRQTKASTIVDADARTQKTTSLVRLIRRYPPGSTLLVPVKGNADSMVEHLLPSDTLLAVELGENKTVHLLGFLSLDGGTLIRPDCSFDEEAFLHYIETRIESRLKAGL